LVIGKIVDIGKAIAKGMQPGGEKGTGVERSINALTWMARAFSILDSSQKDLKLSPGLRVGNDSPLLVNYLIPGTADDTEKSRYALNSSNGAQIVTQPSTLVLHLVGVHS
jgi:hypothetical protein